MKIKGLVLAAALATVSLSSFAQASASLEKRGFHHEGRERIEHRLERQKERIQNKVTLGKLTPTEAQALRAEEDRVQADLVALEAAHDGHLTPEDRAALNHRLDDISRRIGR